MEEIVEDVSESVPTEVGRHSFIRSASGVTVLAVVALLALWFILAFG